MEDQELFAGWLGLHASIGIIVEEKPTLIAQFPYTVITCIDSSSDMQKLRTAQQIVQDFSKDCFFFGRGLQVPGRRVPALARDYNLFNGFDNIWCFYEEPLIPPEPDLQLVGPLRGGGRFAEDAKSPEELKPLIETFKCEKIHLREWMQKSGAVLGLGDGCGLTYATLHKGLADELKNNWGKEKFSCPNDGQ